MEQSARRYSTYSPSFICINDNVVMCLYTEKISIFHAALAGLAHVSQLTFRMKNMVLRPETRRDKNMPNQLFYL